MDTYDSEGVTVFYKKTSHIANDIKTEYQLTIDIRLENFSLLKPYLVLFYFDVKFGKSAYFPIIAHSHTSPHAAVVKQVGDDRRLKYVLPLEVRTSIEVCRTLIEVRLQPHFGLIGHSLVVSPFICNTLFHWIPVISASDDLGPGDLRHPLVISPGDLARSAVISPGDLARWSRTLKDVITAVILAYLKNT